MDTDYEAEFAKLGDTPDAVAASLWAMGIKGDRISGYSCPLAQFASRLGIERPWVSDRYVEGVEPAVTLPVACRKFMRRFDHYEYPQLESS